VDSALGIPAFALGAPAWVQALIAAMILLTVVGVALVAPGLRRRLCPFWLWVIGAVVGVLRAARRTPPGQARLGQK